MLRPSDPRASGVRRQAKDEGTNPTLLRKGSGSFRRLEPELRALASEAYAIWRDLAASRANPYGDHSGCLLAGRMAVEATRWEDGLTILAAIRQRMDEKSSPRWIPEWSRELGGSQREQRRNEERIAQGCDANGRHIPGKDDIEDPDVRRVLVAFGRARAAGATTESWSCVVCRGITDGRCATCAQALHPRSCLQRHECAVPA